MLKATLVSCLLLAGVFASAQFLGMRDTLAAMGVPELGGTVSSRPIKGVSHWRTFTVGDRVSGMIDSSLTKVRSVQIEPKEIERRESAHSGADRAKTLAQAESIAGAFLAKIRPSGEQWEVHRSRNMAGVPSLHDRRSVVFRLKSVDGEAVEPGRVTATVEVLPRSGVVASFTLPWFTLDRRPAAVSEAQARQIAEAHTFRPMSWDQTGKRGKVVSLRRYLLVDDARSGQTLISPRVLVLGWRAVFERGEAEVAIDAQTGQVLSESPGLPN